MALGTINLTLRHYQPIDWLVSACAGHDAWRCPRGALDACKAVTDGSKLLRVVSRAHEEAARTLRRCGRPDMTSRNLAHCSNANFYL